MISYIVFPGCGPWVNNLTKIGSKQGFRPTKRDIRIRGEETDGREGLAVQNKNNGELTPGKKHRVSWRLQTICMTRAKGDAHNFPDDIQHKLMGGLDVQNKNNGELTPGKKQGVSWHLHTYA